ncbi:unnamed protein product [Lampetra planeri]
MKRASEDGNVQEGSAIPWADTSPIGHHVDSFGVKHRFYTDDVRLFASVDSTDASALPEALRSSPPACSSGLWAHGLPLNVSKSDVVPIGTTQRLTTPMLPLSIFIAGSGPRTRSLGVNC